MSIQFEMLPKVLLLAAFCAVAANSVAGANLYGKEMCGKGQVYWCRNLMNAKRCNAVKHCIHSIWEYQILPEDNGNVCNICKDMVSRARPQLKITKTQEELKQVFEDSCKLITEEIVLEECFKFVDDFTTELIETLASQMNPQVVCSVVGLCNSVRNDEFLAEYKRPISPLFPAVQSISRKAELSQLPLRTDDYMTGRWEEEGFGRKETHFPRVSVDTDRPASKNIPDAIHLEELNDPISSHIIKKRSEKIDMDLVNCPLCLAFVPMINGLRMENHTVEDIKQQFHSACNASQHLQKECNEFVEQYTDSVISLLATTTDAQDVCSVLPPCSSTNLYQHKGESNKTPESTYVEEVSHDKNAMDLITCYYCIAYMPVIDRMWKENYKAGIIKHAIHVGCSAAKKSNKECNVLVDHIDSVVSLLAKNMDPDDVCSAISVCSSENDQQLKGESKNIPEMGHDSKNISIKNGVDSFTFILCLSLVPLIDKMRKENHTIVLKHCQELV